MPGFGRSGAFRGHWLRETRRALRLGEGLAVRLDVSHLHTHRALRSGAEPLDATVLRPLVRDTPHFEYVWRRVEGTP